MALNRALQKAPWRVGDASARLLLDIAAGRPITLVRGLNDDEMELAVRHGLIGLMADHENPNLHDPAVALYARLAARQGVMAAHLRRVLAELHAAGIQATVLKGLHLAHWAYGQPNHRTTTDVDLLVPASQVDQAIEVLGGDPSVQTIPPKTPKADKRNIPFVDESGVRFTLDLHWDLFSYTQLRGCADGATEWAWKEATFVEDHPLGPMWELPESARISFLCTHALLDHRFRLILFRDLAEVAANDPDWAGLLRFVRRWKLANPTYLALLIAAGLADAAVPHEVLAAMRDPMTSAAYLERVLPQTDIVRFDGHSLHPLNLAAVLVHDDRRQRLRLAAGAPMAFPHWWKRIGAGRRHAATEPGDKSILLLVSSNRRRGAEVFGERLADGLRDRDWDVDFVALEDTGEEPAVSAVALAETANGGRVDRRLVSLLRSRIARNRPSVVFANGGATLRYAVMATAGMRNKPKVAYASIGEPAYWLRHGRHRALQATLHHRVDLVLAVSAVTREQLIELFRLSPDKVKVAHTGVPLTFFEAPDKTPSEELRVVFLGNLSEEKGPQVALEAIRELNGTTPARMRFVGTGPMLEELKRLVEQSGLADRVEFAGSVVDVRPHLSWADVLILTSETEGFPGVVLEAAAAGTPTVAFGVGGTAETIVDGVTGVVVPPGDSAGLVEALHSLGADRPRLVEMGEDAKARVNANFLLEHAVDRHDELLAEILGVTPFGAGVTT